MKESYATWLRRTGRLHSKEAERLYETIAGWLKEIQQPKDTE